MILDLKKLFSNRADELPFAADLDWSEETYFGSHPFCNPVQISGKAWNTSGIVHLQYRVETVLKMPCDRCAVETERSYAWDFEHILVTELNDEDTGELIVLEKNFQLDLGELVLSDVLLEFPSKFLCKEDCAGLCPGCGVNLNTEKCRCTEKEIDPRLEILKTLLS